TRTGPRGAAAPHRVTGSRRARAHRSRGALVQLQARSRRAGPGARPRCRAHRAVSALESRELSVSTLETLLAHPDIARLAEALASRPGRQLEPEGPMRLAAVALVLRPGDAGDPELLMIKRAEAERDPWSGHVALPGGRMEPRDRDLLETAIRETWEETGVDL